MQRLEENDDHTLIIGPRTENKKMKRGQKSVPRKLDSGRTLRLLDSGQLTAAPVITVYQNLGPPAMQTSVCQSVATLMTCSSSTSSKSLCSSRLNVSRVVVTLNVSIGLTLSRVKEVIPPATNGHLSVYCGLIMNLHAVEMMMRLFEIKFIK